MASTSVLAAATQGQLTAVIEGGQIPSGTVRVSGAKNSATRLLSAALIADGPVRLNNFPTNLVDTRHKVRFIEEIGGAVEIDHAGEAVTIDPLGVRDAYQLEYSSFPIRTTYLLAAGQIKRRGVARIPYPGGCDIGVRGYDLHVMVWQALGAEVIEKEDFIEIRAPRGFRSGEIDFPVSTVGGTENALISAATVPGESVIRNAYITPEVEDLIAFLRTLGVTVEVGGKSLVRVIGADHLSGSIHEVIPDRIEALTWIIYGILSGGRITIENVPFASMEIPLIQLYEAGIDIYQNRSNAIVSPECLTTGVVQPFEIACGTHPGVISDMQPFFVVLGAHADGISRVIDYRYPQRTAYCHQLSQLYPGVLEWECGRITTHGPARPQPGYVMSTDLRGSMALVLAALLAPGRSVVRKVDQALRGYDNLEEKLKDLGVTFDVRADTR